MEFFYNTDTFYHKNCISQHFCVEYYANILKNKYQDIPKFKKKLYKTLYSNVSKSHMVSTTLIVEEKMKTLCMLNII